MGGGIAYSMTKKREDAKYMTYDQHYAEYFIVKGIERSQNSQKNMYKITDIITNSIMGSMKMKLDDRIAKDD